MRLPPAFSEVPVSALAPALAYYRDRLGFAIDWDNEELGLAGLSQGACQLFIAAPHYRRHLATGSGPVVVWFSFSSREEVDDLYQRWRAAGAKLDVPPALNEPYGLYEFLAFDPDENIFRAYHFVSDGEAG